MPMRQGTAIILDGQETNSKSEQKMRKTFVDNSTSGADFIEALEKAANLLPRHLFNAKWQYNMFLKARDDLPAGNVFLVADFAENFRTLYQDEVQSAHWNYGQMFRM